MSNFITTVDATSAVRHSKADPWGFSRHSLPSIATSRRFIFDLKKHLPVLETSDVDQVGIASKELRRRNIHPEDVDFVAKARLAILHKIEGSSVDEASFIASMQFRILASNNESRLVNHILSPLPTSANLPHVVNVFETDLSSVATNPVKTVLIFKAGGDSAGRPLALPKLNHQLNNDCPFSSRQIEIIRLLAEGKTTTDISKALFISADTVRTHRQHILQRSGSTNMTATVVDCVRKGWI